jgi:hypothetical protein
MRFVLSSALCIVFAFTVVHAQRQVLSTVYSEYFSSYDADSVVPNVTLVKHDKNVDTARTEKSPRGIRLLGRFEGGDKVLLHLNDLPEHDRLEISIGFHIIGSWDGVHDNDRLEVIIKGDTVFNHTFSNTIYKQSYPGAKKGRLYPPRTGARNSNMLAYRFTEPGVYDGPMDATYMEDFLVRQADSTVTIEITAYLKDVRSGIDNESWGLEHIKIIAVGPEPPPSMAPAFHIHKPEYDEELVDFAGEDFRVVAGYAQDSHLPGVVKGSPWADVVHSTLMVNRYMRCGDMCLFYTYAIYTDGWVNVWVNSEMGGTAMWSTTLTKSEIDTVGTLVEACVKGAEPVVDYAAEDADMHPDLPHYELHLRTFEGERMISVNGGEPPEITALTQRVLAMIARHGWEPSPFSWD